MTIHLVKLCVGAERIEDQEAWVKRRVARNRKTKWGPFHDHVTRMFPRRQEELLDGGSLYWIIKGVVLVRQKIEGLEKVTCADGIDRCAILLDPNLTPTEAQPRRAFQGWRYLEPVDAPLDMTTQSDCRTPPALRMKLAELGLL